MSFLYIYDINLVKKGIIMKKVVFKGIINGKEFDNVNDYNEEMNRLLGLDECITASSSTNIVEETPQDTKNHFTADDFLPFFGSDDTVHYLDRLVGEDDKLNKESLAYACKIINTTYDQLVSALDTNKITIEEAFELINKIKEIRAQIDNDCNESKQAIADLGKQISEAKKKLALLNNAFPVIDVFKDYYKSAFGAVREYLLKN